MNIELLSAAAQEGTQTVVTMEWSLWSWVSQNTQVSYPVITVLFFAACIIIPYLIGSINPAIIFSKLMFHDDIRTHGSGNAGATNTLRTYGKKVSAAVFACDMLKALIAVAFGWLMMGRTFGGAAAGFFVVLGHMFPLYYKFKGGKGVACAAVVALIMSPISFLLCLLVFIIIVVGTKYVSLASVIGIGLYPLFVSAFPNQNRGAVGLFAVLMAIFVIFMHRGNLKRIAAGEESKLSLGGKKRGKQADDKDTGAEEKAKIYKSSDFVECVGCARTIPISRRVCVYCGEENPAYKPSEADADGGRGAKKGNTPKKNKGSRKKK